MRYLFKSAKKTFDKGVDSVFEAVQTLISSRYWAVGIVLISIFWFVFEGIIVRKPVEGWFNGWLYTVFVYTVLSLWIEAFQKVQTAHMARIQQEQTDRIEFMVRHVVKQNDTHSDVLSIIQNMLKDSAAKDAIIRQLVSQWNQVVPMLLEKK